MSDDIITPRTGCGNDCVVNRIGENYSRLTLNKVNRTFESELPAGTPVGSQGYLKAGIIGGYKI